ncbi:KH domain-containing protein [Caldivirga maquilingensis]|uniref:KH type 1 domain protein n=1 Tax=Caldivirga maquilingensis (strain ATCC 700844 / DSM 13496 / JCM 10307 / IC-167) TaxID=397948 RepID=A8MDF6_CALMQ|nr:KH domain-containing protein [Caldivirga maquilingensis]ABW01812.1 KH type 1 domain protein [Caldivirga maquilingensis IC-167]
MANYYFGGPLEIPLEKAKTLVTEEVKNSIEVNLKVQVEVKDDSVVLTPMQDANPDSVIKARQIIQALALGFSRDDALELLNDDKYLDVVDLSDYIGKDKENHLSRIKAIIIGEGGKVKRNLEELTETKIAVKDKAVGIIGNYDNVRAVRDAIVMLINGRQHSTVYRWLQRWKRDLNLRRIEGNF